jgi:hypothetical protein
LIRKSDTFLKCGGAVKIIACIEAPAVIAKIPAHLNDKVASAGHLFSFYPL